MDVYYETPRLPMFILMEDFNLARVRAIKYVNGKLNSVLADWDVDNIQFEFYGKETFNDECEEPFYCIYKSNEGLYMYNGNIIKYVCEGMIRRGYKEHNAEELFEMFFDKAIELNCPIFESLEDARMYVFQR